MKKIDYNNDFEFIEVTEKLMNRAVWIGLLKGLIISAVLYFIPMSIYVFVVYVIGVLSYNQSRFEATQHHINRLELKTNKLLQRTNKLKYKLIKESYPNYIEDELEKDFLKLERLNDKWDASKL